MDEQRVHKIDTLKRVEIFLRGLAEKGNVSEAALSSGLSRTILYNMRRTDSAFAASWDEALELGVAALEDEATTRAFNRQDKASHVLLIFLLKSHKPSKYRENPPIATLHKSDDQSVNQSLIAQLLATVHQSQPATSDPQSSGPSESSGVCHDSKSGPVETGSAPQPAQPETS